MSPEHNTGNEARSPRRPVATQGLAGPVVVYAELVISSERLAEALPPWLSVDLSVGTVPEKIDDAEQVNPFIWLAADEALVTLRSGIRLWATRDQIVVSPGPGSDEQELTYLVYSSGTRMVLTLREQFSLHASAFLVRGRAVAVMGQAFAGKSTSLLGMSDRGYEPIVDDLLAVDVSGSPITCAGWNRPVHVRTATAAMMPKWQRSPQLAEAVRPDQPHLAAAVSSSVVGVPLAGIIQLGLGNSDAVMRQPLSGLEKLSGIKATTDRFGQDTGGRAEAFFRWATRIAAEIPMITLLRPVEGWSLDPVLDSIEEVAAEWSPTEFDRLSPKIQGGE